MFGGIISDVFFTKTGPGIYITAILFTVIIGSFTKFVIQCVGNWKMARVAKQTTNLIIAIITFCGIWAFIQGILALFN